MTSGRCVTASEPQRTQSIPSHPIHHRSAELYATHPFPARSRPLARGLTEPPRGAVIEGRQKAMRHALVAGQAASRCARRSSLRAATVSGVPRRRASFRPCRRARPGLGYRLSKRCGRKCDLHARPWECPECGGIKRPVVIAGPYWMLARTVCRSHARTRRCRRRTEPAAANRRPVATIASVVPCSSVD